MFTGFLNRTHKPACVLHGSLRHCELYWARQWCFQHSSVFLPVWSWNHQTRKRNEWRQNGWWLACLTLDFSATGFLCRYGSVALSERPASLRNAQLSNATSWRAPLSRICRRRLRRSLCYSLSWLVGGDSEKWRALYRTISFLSWGKYWCEWYPRFQRRTERGLAQWSSAVWYPSCGIQEHLLELPQRTGRTARRLRYLKEWENLEGFRIPLKKNINTSTTLQNTQHYNISPFKSRTLLVICLDFTVAEYYSWKRWISAKCAGSSGELIRHFESLGERNLLYFAH